MSDISQFFTPDGTEERSLNNKEGQIRIRSSDSGVILLETGSREFDGGGSESK